MSRSSKAPFSPYNNLTLWLDRRGFTGNPFEYSNAEYEQEALPGYFVDIGEFDQLLHTHQPSIVYAGRGCGKTAQRQMLAAYCRPVQPDSPFLAIHYTHDGFENVFRQAGGEGNEITASHHIHALLQIGMTALANEIAHDETIRNALNHPDAARQLNAYVQRFAPWEKIEFLDTRPVEPGNKTPLELLRGFAQLLKKTGIQSGIVFLDGLDEFSQTAVSLSHSSAFLQPLLGTLPIIECQGLAFKFFFSEELEAALQQNKWYRPDRMIISHITWDEHRLLALIQQRLTYFSKRKPPYEHLAQLCEDDLGMRINQDLLDFKLPRPVIRLLNQLFQTHANQTSPTERISLATWEGVKQNWRQQQTDSFSDLSSIVDSLVQAKDTGLTSETIEPGVLRVEEEKGLVWLGNHEIRSQINPQDYSVLLCLTSHPHDVCSKEMIVQEAWHIENGAGVSDAAIAASIRRLRQIFASVQPDRDYIVTVRGKERAQGGYRLYPAGQHKSSR